MNKQNETKVEETKEQFEAIEAAKKETKSLRLRTGVKAGDGPIPVCW